MDELEVIAKRGSVADHVTITSIREMSVHAMHTMAHLNSMSRSVPSLEREEGTSRNHSRSCAFSPVLLSPMAHNAEHQQAAPIVIAGQYQYNTRTDSTHTSRLCVTMDDVATVLGEPTEVPRNTGFWMLLGLLDASSATVFGVRRPGELEAP